MIRDPEACIGPFFWSCWVSLKMAAGPRGMLAEMPAPVCSLIVADLYDQEPRPDDPSCGLASWSSGPSWSKHFLTLQMQAPLSHYKSVTKVQVKILSFSPRNFFFGRHQPTLLSTQNQVYADHAVPFHYCAAQTDAAQKNLSLVSSTVSTMARTSHGHYEGYDSCPNSQHTFSGDFVHNNDVADDAVQCLAFIPKCDFIIQTNQI